jgi:hypothetical protein
MLHTATPISSAAPTVALAPWMTSANHSATVAATIAISTDAATRTGSYWTRPATRIADIPM